MTNPNPAELNLEQLSQLRSNAASEITAILNRFSEQTGLDVYGVNIDILYRIGGSLRYYTELDIRL